MGDDDMRHELRERVDLLAAVLVDVHDEVGGRGGADFFDVGVLGAAHLGDARDGCARVDAEAAAADEVAGEAEVAEEFGEAGDEADDAGFALRGACWVPRASRSSLVRAWRILPPVRCKRSAGSCAPRRRGRGR
jgi:hypothetical protein